MIVRSGSRTTSVISLVLVLRMVFTRWGRYETPLFAIAAIACARSFSIVCFVVDKPEQGRGVAALLLDAAVRHAFAHGAVSVEAYPHVARGDDYMGGLELYERAGFAKTRDANKRAIVRLER